MWNPKSRIQLLESGISQYSINDWNPESKSSTDKDWNPECTARNTESKPLLGLILGRAYLQIYPGGWALGYKASAREASLLDAILSDVHPSIRMKVVWPHVIVGAFMLRLTLKVEANKISGYPMQRTGHKLFVL